MHDHSWVGADPTRMQSSPAVVALWERWGDATAVLNAVTTLSTWGQLVSLSPAERIHIAGPVLGRIDLPAACPPLMELPGGGRPLTPYDREFPQRVQGTTWPVLYVAGTLPLARGVMIIGASDPTPQAVEVARSAALAAAGDRVPVIATPTPGAGLIALRTAVDAGGRAVAVVPHDMSQHATYQGLLDDVRRHGGAVITSARPGAAASPEQMVRAAHLMAALAHAVVIAEVGPPPSPATTQTAAAIAAGLHLIVPRAPAHHVPASAMGLAMLTTPRAFTPAWFGTSERIEERIRAGLPAADDVVVDQHEIGQALSRVCHAGDDVS